VWDHNLPTHPRPGVPQ